MILRPELESDLRAVEELTRDAFWNVHVPGCNEHYLLNVMRGVEAFIPALDTVAEENGRLVGNIVYTKAKIAGSDGTRVDVLSFGPVSVPPADQGKGVGSALIRHTLARARALGHGAVLIYGDPDYYGRFGFVPAEEYGIGTAQGMYATPLLALELVPSALADARGRFFEDEVFDVDEDAARAFDRGFPTREKRENLPSQARFRALVSMRRPMDTADA